jgi:hypothetical protein
MWHGPEDTTGAPTGSKATLAEPHRDVRARATLGTGFGDRFEDFQGASESFEGRVQQGEEQAELQGKGATKRGFQIA